MSHTVEHSRISVRTVLDEEGLGRVAGDKGLGEDTIAKGLAPATELSHAGFLGSMLGGKALGETLGLASKGQVARRVAQPYGSVLRAMVVAMSGGPSGLSSATDTRQGAYLEGSMPKDLFSLGGSIVFDVIDRGDQGVEIIGASEVKGQVFDWGKGKRALAAVLDKAEQLARRF